MAKENSKKNHFGFIIGAMIVLVIGCLAGINFILFNNEQSDTTRDTITEQEIVDTIDATENDTVSFEDAVEDTIIIISEE